ncbi:MAG: transporter substrate-binding domain-containing protein [Acetobacteraceae bacterium]|nr:transporter substrate-binding domain-containing protein [Acetobacteraceae bacterium]
MVLTPGARTPWRFGVLFSRSGVTAAVETTQLNATILAIESVNAEGGIRGRPIEPVIYDPASNPKQFHVLAERLLGKDRVRLLFGCYMSSTRKAVLPVVEAYRGLLLYPTLYEGFEYSPNCIYTGAAPNQNSLPLARYLFGRYGKRMLFVGSNYVYPYESNRIMAELARQAGGSILDEIYVPLDAGPRDFAKAIREIGRLRPDVIFSTVVGRSTAVFYEAYRQAGFDPAHIPIASLTTSEAEVAEMTPQAARGHVTAAPFFDTLARPAAERFVATYRHRFGAGSAVTAAAEAAYFQVTLVAGAIERAGTDELDFVRAALGTLECDAPQGPVQIDPSNNHTYLWPRVAELDAQSRFRIVWDPGVRVRPDPYCVDQRWDGWPEQAWPGSLPLPTQVQ